MEESSRKKRRIVEEASASFDDFDTSHETSCGIIQSVTVKNFMCHEHLIAEFKPNINLVQGRNGSGKSAILTAVVVALGGSTRSTNRGSSLKELIKYDKNTATVQVLITNNGKDAYRHDIYGNIITIERKINSGGGGGYKIKSSDGRIVTSKKEDLKRLCDYFNLNVENPLTVLNQDMSRSFLNSSEPQKLYKFFLQATQLQQMCDYYSQLNDCLKISTNLIEDRKACLPILEQEVQELSNRYEFCIKHTDKRKKLKDLRRELVWAKITQLEERSESAKKYLDQCQRIILKFEEKQSQLKSEVDRAKQEHKNVEDQYFVISEEIKIQSRSYKLQNEAQSKSKEKWKEMQRQVEKARRQVEMYNKEISALKEAVKRDHTSAQQVWEEEHKLHQEQIQSTESQIAELNQIMKTEDTHLNNIQHTIKLSQDNHQQLQFEDKNKRRNMQELEQELRTLQSQQTNSFTVFGQWVQSLLDKIENAFRQGRFSAKPVGPLGAYVEMRESQWAHIAEMVIGGRISAFCVNNSQDEKVLRSLFQGINFGSQQPMIICCRFRKRHDASLISKYEVQSDTYPSLWSILKINHDVVANYIIDRCQVETIMLIPTASEAGELLKNSATVPHNCKTAYTLNGDKYFPDPNYKVYSGFGQKRARYLQVSAGERAQGVTVDIRRVKEELENIQEERRKVDAELNSLRRQERESQLKLQKEKSKFKGLRERLMQLQSQEEPPPPNISQLEEDIAKQENKQSAAMETLNVAEERMKVMDEEYQKAQTAVNISKQKMATISTTAHELEEKMRETEEKANKLMHSDDVLKQTLKNHERKKNELEIKNNEAENNLQKEKEMANASFLPRIETERSPDEIERKYKNLEAKLNKEQEQRGDPIQIGEKYKEMKERYRKMNAELDANTNLIKKLRDSLQERHMQCTHFRKVLSIMIKTNFMESLQLRKMAGKILFDFEKEMLHISVMKKNKESDVDVSNTSSNERKKANQQKLAMMSGGERSFATVSFILALWEVMESPVRILDEFDVFMDIIARRQSLDMMIQAAKPKTQYIYLTPLEVNKNHYSSKLNVFRMPDPERGDTQDSSQNNAA